MIGNHRTYRLQAGWKIESGASYKIVNNVDYAGWVMGTSQARQPGMVGWQKAWDIITANAAGAIKAAQAAAMAALNAK